MQTPPNTHNKMASTPIHHVKNFFEPERVAVVRNLVVELCNALNTTQGLPSTIRETMNTIRQNIAFAVDNQNIQALSRTPHMINSIIEKRRCCMIWLDDEAFHSLQILHINVKKLAGFTA